MYVAIVWHLLICNRGITQALPINHIHTSKVSTQLFTDKEHYACVRQLWFYWSGTTWHEGMWRPKYHMMQLYMDTCIHILNVGSRHGPGVKEPPLSFFDWIATLNISIRLWQSFWPLSFAVIQSWIQIAIVGIRTACASNRPSKLDVFIISRSFMGL